MACGGVARAAQKTGGAGSKKPPAAQPAKAKPAPAATHTVVVYYLYTEPRCISCTNIEKFTKEAIEKEFAKELKSGRLVWMPVDVKKDGNWHYVEDFQLRSKTVVVADYKDSREDKNKIIAWKSLEEVWPLLKDKKKFMEYIQTEARIFLDQKYEKPKSDEKKDAGKAGGEKK
jgi:hypothetical protein